MINAMLLPSLTCPESTGIKSLTRVMPDDLSNLLALNLTIDAPEDIFFNCFLPSLSFEYKLSSSEVETGPTSGTVGAKVLTESFSVSSPDDVA